MGRRTAICFLPFLLCLLAFQPAEGDNASDLRLVTVTGDAAVKVVPDEVIITLGVETWNTDLSIAKQENDQKIQAIIATARELGIEPKHIQTDYLNIEPRYDQQWEHREFIGYFVRKDVAITLRDVSGFETLLAGVLNAGANYVHGVEFRTTELRKYKDQARSMAIKAAQEKATALARELGAEIGRPHTIQEGHVGWWSGYSSYWGSRWSGYMSQNVVQNAGTPSEGEGSVALGQISVNANVTVSFELH